MNTPINPSQRETPDSQSGAPQNLTTDPTWQSVKMASLVNAKSDVFDPPISVVTSAEDTRTTPTTLRTVLEGIKAGTWREEMLPVRAAAQDFMAAETIAKAAKTYAAANLSDSAAAKKAAAAEKAADAKKAALDKLKKKLPAALFSGTFTTRSIAGLAKHSGLICCDLDKLGDSLTAVRGMIEADPHTLAALLSPSGTGLKVILRCDPLRPHLESFNAARRHFRERFGLEIDGACSDVARLCFVSFDPDLFARDDAPPIPYSAGDTVNLAAGVAEVNGNAGVVPMQAGAQVTGYAALVPMPNSLGSMSKEEIREKLAQITAPLAYLDWLRVSSAVFSALSYGDSFDVLNEWRPEEQPGEYLYKYKKRLTKVEIGTLVCYARHNGPPPLPTNPVDLASRLAARRYNHSTPPPKPEPRFSINGRVVCTAGNLTTIGAQAKAGKSAVIGAMIAAVTCAELSITGRDTLGVSASPPGHKKLLHFDTEQSPHDAHALIQRSLRRAGGGGVPKFLDSYGLAGFSAPDLVAALELKMAEWGAVDGIYAVILDGGADLVGDVNNAEECNRFIAKLHGLAISYDCPIISVLHENPTQESGKMRGHLGSQLERKAESNIRLKRVGDTTVIFGEKMRGVPILEKDGPCVRWSPIDDMHMSVSNLSLTADDRLRAEMEDEAEDVFRPHLVTVLSRKDLVAGIRVARPPIGVSGAGKRFDHMKRLGVIIKDMKTGLWMISVI